jgi:SAM-dependent methyltransferase
VGSREITGGADRGTAEAFADYFRTLGPESVYTDEQFRDFFAPLNPDDFRGRDVIELGFGHGSFLQHFATRSPAHLRGVELGDGIEEARRRLGGVPASALDLQRGDLTCADLGEHDLAYCIGVLHHLTTPESGFESLLRHTRPGGCFHGWVYSREGNALVVYVVDPLRALTARLPWWATRYGAALAVAALGFVYARGIRALRRLGAGRWLRRLPQSEYCLAIADRDFAFFHHLATDFLVARRTVYIDRARVERWLRHPEVEPGSTYLVHRNGNSWKFGGRRRAAPEAHFVR